MKKLLILLLCILLLSGCAVTYDGPTETVLVLTEYQVTHYYSFSFSDGAYTSRTAFAYDIYGNQASSRDYDDDALNSVANYRYDDRGNRISETLWDHSGWIPYIERRIKQTYDDQDRVLERIYYDTWGRETGRSSYIYDDADRTMTWSNSEGDQVITYYDEKGLELRTVSTGVGGSYETIHAYDDQGNRISWYSTKDGAVWGRYEAGYDDQGRQLWGTHYDENGDRTSHITLTYDDEQHTTTRIDNDGDRRITYYDADGNIQLIEDYDAEGELTMTQQYFYREIRVPADRKE